MEAQKHRRPVIGELSKTDGELGRRWTSLTGRLTGSLRISRGFGRQRRALWRMHNWRKLEAVLQTKAWREDSMTRTAGWHPSGQELSCGGAHQVKKDRSAHSFPRCEAAHFWAWPGLAQPPFVDLGAGEPGHNDGFNAFWRCLSCALFETCSWKYAVWRKLTGMAGLLGLLHSES